jgi:CzcA family heavy metal efflux pump
MLAAAIRLSLRFPAVVCVLALILIGYGLLVVAEAKYDVFPEFVPAQANVQTEAPGLVAEQVERLVTLPIEESISGAPGVEAVRSETISGLSNVTVVFAENSDPYRARQVVGEAIAEVAARLPAGVKTPKLTPLVSSTMDLLKLGFVSDRLTPMELRDLVQWTIRPRLLAVPGVARATLYGGDERQLQVEIGSRVLNSLNLSFSDVIAAVQGATGVRGSGFIETPNQRVLIESHGQTLTAAALAEAIVPSQSGGGAPLRLKDFATVEDAAAPKFGDAIIMGKPGVLLSLSSQFGANTLDVTRATEEAIAALKPTLDAKGVKLYPRMHRPANFIENALHGVLLDVLIGTVLITLVLFLFLRDLRSVLVSFASIPIALLTTVIVINGLGWTINTMTLGGLAVALGVVVDDAIIDVENIMRRMRTRTDGRPIRDVVLAASVEVREPVVYATFVVVLVLMPMLLLSGLQGKFFGPLAAAFMIATLASLVVAITVTPAASFLLLTRARPHAEPSWLQRSKASHERLLRRWCSAPGWVIAGSVLITVLASAALPFFGSQLMPPFREGHFVVQAVAPPGTSLGAAMRTGERISRDFLAIPGVLTVEHQIGRAEQGEDTWEPNRSEFHIEIKKMSGHEEQQTQEAIRTTLERYPDFQTQVMTFLADRLSESLSGETAPVAINVFGNDLDELDRVADRIAAVARSIPGAEGVQVQAPSGAAFLRIDLQHERLQQYGFTAAEVLDTVQTAYEGTTAAQIYDANRVVNLVVRLPPAERLDPESVGSLLIRAGSGITVPLRDLATLSLTEGRTSIMHEGARRRQVVTINPDTPDIGGFVDQVKESVAQKVRLPGTVYLEFAGAAAGEAAARRELLTHAAFAVVGIILLLSIAFGDPRSVILILAMTPFALVGGVLAVAMTGATLSIGSLVGFVTLFGVVARNAILMVAHVEHLVRAEGETWSLEAVLRGARERLVPILMTALVTALGLLPLAAASGEVGREVQGPMAQVILGGLVTSTVMNLLVLPVLLWRFGPLGRARTAGPRIGARVDGPQP